MFKGFLSQGILLVVLVAIVLAGCGEGSEVRTLQEDRKITLGNEIIINENSVEQATVEIQRNKPSAGFGSEILGFDIPATMKAGDVYKASITFRNSGDEVWSNFRLGGSGDATSFSFWRADVHKSLEIGDTMTIPFMLLAPTETGKYSLEFRMVEDGVRWFGQTLKAGIQIEPSESIVKKQTIDKINIKFSDDDLEAIENFIQESSVAHYKADWANNWRKARMTYNGEEYEMEFAIHGDTSEHWGNSVKSYKIKLSNGRTISRMREFSLITFTERKYNSLINQYYVDLLGVYALRNKLVRMAINDEEYNLYYLRENTAKEALEANGFSNTSFLNRLFIREPKIRSFISTAGGPGHTSFIDHEMSTHEIKGAPIDQKKIYYMIYLLKQALSQESNKLFDLFDYNYLVNFEALRTILLTSHDIDGDNLRFSYKETNGKFYPLVGSESVSIYKDYYFDTMTSRVGAGSALIRLFAIFNSDNDFRQDKYRKIWQVINDDASFLQLVKLIRGYHVSINKVYSISNYTDDKLNLSYPHVLTNIALLKSELSTSKLVVFFSKQSNQLTVRLNPLSLAELKLNKLYLNFQNEFQRGTVLNILIRQGEKELSIRKTLEASSNQVDLSEILDEFDLFLALNDVLTPITNEIVINIKYPSNNFTTIFLEVINDITDANLVQDEDVFISQDADFYQDTIEKFFHYDATRYPGGGSVNYLYRSEADDVRFQEDYRKLWAELQTQQMSGAEIKDKFSSIVHASRNAGPKSSDKDLRSALDFELNLSKVFISVIQKHKTLTFEIMPMALSDLLFEKIQLQLVAEVPNGQKLAVKIHDHTGKALFENEITLDEKSEKPDIAALFNGFLFHTYMDLDNLTIPTTYSAEISFIDYPYDIALKDVEFKVINDVTKKKAGKDDIYYAIADGNDFFMDEKFLAPEEVKQRYDFFEVANGTLVLDGDISIDETVIIPYDTQLIIKPGTTLTLGNGVSLLSYSPIIAEGSFDEKITVQPSDFKKTFGVFALSEKGANGSRFKHFQIQGGSETHINGIYFSGMFSAYHVDDLIIENSIFKDANADDALNIKYSDAKVINSEFIENSADAIDFDFVDGEITGNKFTANGNDSIDTSGSGGIIRNNVISRSGDKCMSIGEESAPLILNNIMDGCVIGIEVKDLSTPLILNNLIINNEIGINSFQKKIHFGPAHAEVWNTLFYSNKRQIAFENTFEGKKLPSDDSDISIQYSNVPGGHSGKKNISKWFLSNEKYIEEKGSLEIILKYAPDYEGKARIGLLSEL